MNDPTRVRVHRLEVLAQKLETFCQSHLWVCIFGAAVVYFSAMVIQSDLKPLWYDEVFTHMLAALPIARLWEALKSGAEVHPPLSILLAHLVQKVLGPTALASRLPSICAFFGLTLSVFLIVRTELTATWGVVAALVLFLTRAEFYATEARPYAILMCCSACSLLCWQRRLNSPASRWPLVGVALSIATAISAHFFGLLTPFPIALGELYRTRRSRRIDVWFWAAVLVGMSVVIAYFPIIRTTKRYVAHNINPSRLGMVGQLYLQPLGPPLLILLPILLVALLLQFRVVKPLRFCPLRLVTIAALGMVVLPLFQVLLGRFTNSMNPRYTESVVIGHTLLFCFVVSTVFDRNRAVAFVCLVIFGTATVATCISQFENSDPDQAVSKLDVRGLPDMPIVVDQALLYMPLQYYNPELRNRIYFVASPEDSIRTINSDTLDLNLISQRGWLPLNIATKDQFFRKGSKFLLFAGSAPQGWLPTWELEEVARMGGQAREVRRIGKSGYLFQVAIPNE